MRTRLMAALFAAALLASPTLAAETIAGWRTDSTGRYPKARPPVKWSTSENVVWATPMPSWGNAPAVVHGNRIFTTAEPYKLICLDLRSGKILWQHDNGLDLVRSEEEQKEAAEALVKAKPVQDELSKLNRERRKVGQQIKKKQGDAAALRKRMREIRKKQRELNKQLAPFKKYLAPRAHKDNGFSSSTPVTDGKHVFMTFGSGVVACYTVGGRRKWARVVGKPTQGHGHCASPVLVDGKVLVQLGKLHALDAETGKTLWSANVADRFGTAVHTKIGDEDVVVTPAGDIVRVADGRIMVKRLSKLDYNAPIIENGIIYFIQNGGKAFKLPEALDGDTIKPAALWRTSIKSDRYYSSPVLHKGLIYAVTRAGIFSVIDAKDGKKVYEKDLRGELQIKGSNGVYPSIALARELLYIGSESGKTIIIETGRTYRKTAVNPLEQYRGSPVFIGKRMYIRGFKKLYCIGT